MKLKILTTDAKMAFSFFGATTPSIMTLSKKTFIIMTLSIKGLYVTLGIHETHH